MKKSLNYDQLLWKLQKMPALLGQYEDILQQVVDFATTELQDVSKLRVIHGDFWTGK
jgi:fructosamine-3-kinase